MESANINYELCEAQYRVYQLEKALNDILKGKDNPCFIRKEALAGRWPPSKAALAGFFNLSPESINHG